MRQAGKPRVPSGSGLGFSSTCPLQQGQLAPQPLPYTEQPQAGYGAPPKQQYGDPAQGGPVSPPVTSMIVQPPEPAQAVMNNVLFAAYVTSCLTTWLCNIIFGAFGFCIALGASSAMSRRNYAEGRRLAYVAIIVSVAGILVCMCVALGVGLQVLAWSLDERQ